MDGVNWGWVFAGAALLWGVVSFIWMLRLNANRASKDEIDSIITRLTKVEAHIEQLPTKEMVHQIDKEIAVLTGALKVQTEAMKPIAASVTRIDNFLMTHNWSRDDNE